MIKDYVKHNKKQQRFSAKTRLGFLALSGLLSVALAGYFYYQHELTVAKLEKVALQEVSTYFPHIFQQGEQQLIGKKLASTKAEGTAPIHFDFYDELPKMQVAPREKKDLARVEEAETPTEQSKTVAVSLPTATVKKESRINFSAKNIEQDLYADLSAMKAPEPAPYILQIGVFHRLDAANRYRKALLSAGLKVEVKKVKQGQELVFRLQQGPYTNMEQLKAAKKRLSERGVTCDIRKLQPHET